MFLCWENRGICEVEVQGWQAWHVSSPPTPHGPCTALGLTVTNSSRSPRRLLIIGCVIRWRPQIGSHTQGSWHPGSVSLLSCWAAAGRATDGCLWEPGCSGLGLD